MSIGRTNAVIGGSSVPSSALSLTSEVSYKFYGGTWDWFINQFGNQITTSNLSDTTSMFNWSYVTTIPFSINYNSSGADAGGTFQNARNLTSLPVITGRAKETDHLCYACYKLRDVSGISGLQLSTGLSAYHDLSRMFYDCYSLRTIPDQFFTNVQSAGDTWTDRHSLYLTYSFYYTSFCNCYVLDEIINYPVLFEYSNNNVFTGTFDNTSRLKSFTFRLDNGSPYTRSWKGTVIDLSYYVGYTQAKSYVLNYNSGITADKEVTDDASYAALKEDPDWYTLDVAYSRYNHDSAVATINSLPDVSGSGGTNTIKFKGASGSATDGGAINTLTSEEIAVAAAKGWTVTLV